MKRDARKKIVAGTGRTLEEYADDLGGELVTVGDAHGLIYVKEGEIDPEEMKRGVRLDEILDELVPLLNADETDPRLRGLVRELIAFFLEEDERWRERAKGYLEELFNSALEEIAAPRRKGAMEKLKRDPAQAARVEARALWPEANRKGWTAERLHLELSRKGHAVKADTVRKWLTKLRKTGIC